jgi:hypothetical protein
MISTLYRTEKDETFKGTDAGILILKADALKLLAAEVMALLRKNAGTNDYVQAYQQVVDHITSVRRDRRSVKSIQAIADPKAAILRKYH